MSSQLIKPRSPRCGGRGFTMIEMMVAITVTILLMGFLSQIFGTLSHAAKQGGSLSHVIQKGDVFLRLFEKDIAQMLSRESGGMISFETSEVPAHVSKETKRRQQPTLKFRSDRIAFLRHRGELTPLCHSMHNTFKAIESRASVVRVWYGHGLRSKRERSGITSSGGGLGQDGLNEFAASWILCRQPLFLDPHQENSYAVSDFNDTKITQGISDVVKKGRYDMGVNNLMLSSLLVNQHASPDDDAIGFEVDRISQQHSFVAEGVSDLSFEYAPDNGSGQMTISNGKIDWQHDASAWGRGTQDWPHLIRVTYRIHDEEGAVLRNTKGQADPNFPNGASGLVFQRIFRIQR